MREESSWAGWIATYVYFFLCKQRRGFYSPSFFQSCPQPPRKNSFPGQHPGFGRHHGFPSHLAAATRWPPWKASGTRRCAFSGTAKGRIPVLRPERAWCFPCNFSNRFLSRLVSIVRTRLPAVPDHAPFLGRRVAELRGLPLLLQPAPLPCRRVTAERALAGKDVREARCSNAAGAQDSPPAHHRLCPRTGRWLWNWCNRLPCPSW
jgi:hypothetical protein